MLGPGHAHPFLDAAVPCCRRAAPSRVLAHDAPRAIGHADLVQDVSDMDAEFFEPCIVRATRLAFSKNDNVILVDGKQALATARRTQNGNRVSARRYAIARLAQTLLCDERSFASKSAEPVRNYRSDIARADVLFQ